MWLFEIIIRIKFYPIILITKFTLYTTNYTFISTTRLYHMGNNYFFISFSLLQLGSNELY